MRYEYKTLTITNDKLENSCKGLMAMLNHMASSGWELVSILSNHSLGSSQYNLFGIIQKQFLILKRPTVQKTSL